jgi:hypothetical protein
VSEHTIIVAATVNKLFAHEKKKTAMAARIDAALRTRGQGEFTVRQKDCIAYRTRLPSPLNII